MFCPACLDPITEYVMHSEVCRCYGITSHDQLMRLEPDYTKVDVQICEREDHHEDILRIYYGDVVVDDVVFSTVDYDEVRFLASSLQIAYAR